MDTTHEMKCYYLYISLSSYLFYNTEHCIFFVCMHLLTLIQQINVLYILLQAYTKSNQVCPPVMRVNGDFKALDSELLLNEADRSC